MRRRSPKYWIAGLFFIAIIGYAFYQTRDWLSGPNIVIDTPTNGASFDQSLIEISGQIKNIAKLYLDGRPIFADQEARFKESLLLAYGYNIVELRAEDRFGREISKTLELVRY